jgi:hypothetical protein
LSTGRKEHAKQVKQARKWAGSFFKSAAMGAAGLGGLLAGGCSSSSGSTPIPPHDAGVDATHPVDAHVAKETGKPDTSTKKAHDAGSCTDGMCTTTLASGQGTEPNVVLDLVIDDTNVYWIPGGGGASGSVVSVPKAGGTVTTLASGIELAQGLAEDTDNLYFVSHNVGIERIAKAGGAKTVLLQDGTLDAGVFPEFWLLVAHPDIYYVGGLNTDVYDLVLDGGGIPVTVATAGGILGAPGTGYNALAVDDAGVYYDTSSQIVILDRATHQPVGAVPGSSPTAGNRFGPTIAIDEASIYYVSNVVADGGTASSIVKAGKGASDGGGIATVITSDSVLFDDGPIVVDATNVYWSHLVDPATFTGAVLSVPKAGGTVVTVATDCYDHCPFAVDATSIYWAASDGTIRSAPKTP